MSNKWVWGVFIIETCLPIFYLQCMAPIGQLAAASTRTASMLQLIPSIELIYWTIVSV